MEGVECQAAAPHAPGAAQDTAASDDASMYSSLANFKVARQVGSGQFSCVFKAVCTAHPSRPSVALKKVKIFEMMDAKSRADCIKEIELLRQCTHPNIITYLGSFIEENVLNIVLEFAAAGDLTRVLGHYKKHRRLFPEKMVWKYFVQLCAAVDHMHARRVMHRDIKPDNVFITATGVVKLGDLGLGRFLSSGTNVAHSVCGTPYYMAPERVHEDSYSFKSDVWSLGCVLYEMAALQSPFFEHGLSLLGLCHKIRACAYQALPPGLYSSQLQGLASGCIVVDPLQRLDAAQVYEVARQMHALHCPAQPLPTAAAAAATSGAAPSRALAAAQPQRSRSSGATPTLLAVA